MSSSNVRVGGAVARVLIADEQPASRSALRRLLTRSGFEVCGEAASAEAAVEEAIARRPELCVLDVLLPGGAVTAIAEITRAAPGTAIVVLTASSDDSHLFDAVRAGAVGYLPKSMDSERLPHALRGVLAGEAAIPRTVLRGLLGDYRSHGQSYSLRVSGMTVELTPREREVLVLLRDDLSTREIAERLRVSPVTVRRHVSALLGKLGVKDRRAAKALVGELD